MCKYIQLISITIRHKIIDNFRDKTTSYFNFSEFYILVMTTKNVMPHIVHNTY